MRPAKAPLYSSAIWASGRGGRTSTPAIASASTRPRTRAASLPAPTRTNRASGSAARTTGAASRITSRPWAYPNVPAKMMTRSPFGDRSSRTSGVGAPGAKSSRSTPLRTRCRRSAGTPLSVRRARTCACVTGAINSACRYRDALEPVQGSPQRAVRQHPHLDGRVRPEVGDEEPVMASSREPVDDGGDDGEQWWRFDEDDVGARSARHRQRRRARRTTRN